MDRCEYTTGKNNAFIQEDDKNYIKQQITFWGKVFAILTTKTFISLAYKGILKLLLKRQKILLLLKITFQQKIGNEETGNSYKNKNGQYTLKKESKSLEIKEV